MNVIFSNIEGLYAYTKEEMYDYFLGNAETICKDPYAKIERDIKAAQKAADQPEADDEAKELQPHQIYN